MLRTKLYLPVVLAVGVSLAGHNVRAEAPSNEVMWEMLQKQAKEIEQLRQQNQQLQQQLEVSTQIAEQAASAASSAASTQASAGAVAKKTSIGGYGELHYNNLDSKNELDFHRFVLFFSHHFNDKTRFFSELELEHALSGDGKNGEVELEQAYIEHDLTDKLSAKAGVFLMPVGILNETHEPDTFYGVERNPVEKDIIPTTWWEGGLGLTGRMAPGWSYDVALTSGLNVNSGYSVRSGRQKVSNAVANDGAITARLKWTGRPGLELAATVQHQQDVRQGQDADSVSATLLETHAVWQRGPFGLRALYAQWDLDGSGPKATGRDKQRGWYVEPSYKLNPKFGVFARYSEWDNNAGSSAATEKTQTDVGLNYWLHDNVVFKFDMQRQGGAASDDGFNLGVGYQF